MVKISAGVIRTSIPKVEQWKLQGHHKTPVDEDSHHTHYDYDMEHDE